MGKSYKNLIWAFLFTLLVVFIIIGSIMLSLLEGGI